MRASSSGVIQPIIRTENLMSEIFWSVPNFIPGFSLLWPLPDTSPPLPLATMAADPKKKKKNDIAKTVKVLWFTIKGLNSRIFIVLDEMSWNREM